jgi:pimeloyl-ACP methyl ester carboxylesterase
MCLIAIASGAAARSQAADALGLHRCRDGAALCGTLDRALDPQGIVAGRIGIYFELYPHRAPGPAEGTVVATEGGPGYPATESRADYLSLFAPLRSHRDLLLMDNRGTGRSAAVDCAELQRSARWTTALVGDCGRALGARAPLYSTAYAADDLAALLDALEVKQIDLYGDSYGTYFEQVFALRHGGRLRSIVLDGAYPLDGPDEAWYPTYAPAMRAKFNLSCARTPECAALPGDSIAHMQPALELLRQAPFAAQAADATGRIVDFRADAAALAIVLFGGAPALTTTREADAATPCCA